MSMQEEALLPVAGVRLAAVQAGIKKRDRHDLVLLELAREAQCAAVFTRNAFCAAPVQIAREHLRVARPRFLLINTGYANAGLGEQGLRDARACCQALAAQTGCRIEEVLPFSTGVIGEPLPVTRITTALPDAYGALHAHGWQLAAQAILTTDTRPKGVSRTVQIGERTLTLTGIAKGAGMIRPDMATMLAFIATDAAVSPAALQAALQQAVDVSFNRITVDGDTSTNDACVLMATGAAGNTPLAPHVPGHAEFCATLAEVCGVLAQAIVRDGEGATKFITIDVTGGANTAECLTVAYAVAHSPLVKTAFFAGDPNWGRILAAIGRAGIEDLAVARIRIDLGDAPVVREGARAAEYDETLAQGILAKAEFTVRIDLGRGEAAARIWTCDLSHDYVRINAEYRS